MLAWTYQWGGKGGKLYFIALCSVNVDIGTERNLVSTNREQLYQRQDCDTGKHSITFWSSVVNSISQSNENLIYIEILQRNVFFITGKVN